MTKLNLTSQSLNKKSQNPINKLWQSIEKKKARNEKLKLKIEQFSEQFKAHMQPHEQLICDTTEAFILHLLSFINKKSIKGYQRDTLYDWILDELQTLEANPFRTNDIASLRDQFQQGMLQFEKETNGFEGHDDIDEQLAAMRSMLEDFIGQPLDVSDEELTKLIENPSNIEPFLAELLARLENEQFESDDFNEDIDWEGPNQHSRSSNDGAFFQDIDNTPPTAELFKQSEIAALYRQLAKKLHPDKESDDTQKEQKKELMQQLSKMKKDQDIFGLLQMAQQWLPDTDLNLDKRSIKLLENNLKQQLVKLDYEYAEIKSDNSFEGHIWHRFGGRNKREQEKNLHMYADNLRIQTHHLQLMIKNTRTVKSMQQQLKERNHPMFNQFDDDMLHELINMMEVR